MHIPDFHGWEDSHIFSIGSLSRILKGGLPQRSRNQHLTIRVEVHPDPRNIELLVDVATKSKKMQIKLDLDHLLVLLAGELHACGSFEGPVRAPIA